MGRCRVYIHYTLVLFYRGALLSCYSNLLLGEFDQFFRQDMVEKIALQGRCWYQAMIKVTVIFFFKGNHQKHRKRQNREIYGI